jgi:hypothetical protein
LIWVLFASRVHDERVLVVVEQPVALLRDHGRQHDVAVVACVILIGCSSAGLLSPAVPLDERVQRPDVNTTSSLTTTS